ncbi:MAG TPA: hypothetical protein GXZ48_07505 [Acholeplasmataceae bacterium]|nr:hypothetical protein [Acholeplasmataceae bacterium]
MRIVREFIFIPIVLLIFTFLATNAYGFVYGNIARALFPVDGSTLELSKIYVTSMISFVILEYFIRSTLPNNYFFSRMLGMLTMMNLFIIFDTYYNITIYHHLFIILSGCGISFIIQSIYEVRYQNFLALLILSVVLVYLLIVSF